jgi:F-type H+-transporting ATPase subunit epsilon
MVVEIITPDQKLYSGEAKLVQLPGEKGVFEILVNHASIISSLQKGLVKVIDQNDKKLFFDITGGVVECKLNDIIILATEGEISVQK